VSEAQTIFERLELKYLIDEVTAGEIRREIKRVCAPDAFNGRAPGGGYPIYSLYLDTHDLAFHRAKLNKEPDRLKLRIRTYDDTGAAHLEIKRKTVDVIYKTRVTVDRKTAQDSAAGFGAPLKDNPKSRKLLDRFAYFAALTCAEPTVMVRYEREAFASEVDGYARATFDRRIAVRAPLGPEGWDLSGERGEWHSIDDAWQLDGLHSPVVLELKCETRVPPWMDLIIHNFELQRTGFSKYSWGVEVLGLAERGLSGRMPTDQEQQLD
jgi:hypothetical protein